MALRRKLLRRWDAVRTASVAARNAGLTDGANSERIISYGNNKQKVSEREKVTFSLRKTQLWGYVV